MDGEGLFISKVKTERAFKVPKDFLEYGGSFSLKMIIAITGLNKLASEKVIGVGIPHGLGLKSSKVERLQSPADENFSVCPQRFSKGNQIIVLSVQKFETLMEPARSGTAFVDGRKRAAAARARGCAKKGQNARESSAGEDEDEDDDEDDDDDDAYEQKKKEHDTSARLATEYLSKPRATRQEQKTSRLEEPKNTGELCALATEFIKMNPTLGLATGKLLNKEQALALADDFIKGDQSRAPPELARFIVNLGGQQKFDSKMRATDLKSANWGMLPQGGARRTHRARQQRAARAGQLRRVFRGVARG